MQQADLATFCRDWLAAWMSGSAEKLRGFYGKDAYYSDPGRPQGLRGAELLPYFEKLLAKYPGWTWEAVEILPTAKGFCLKWEADFRQGPKVIGLDIVELEGRLITRNEVYFDRAPLMK